MPTCTTETPIVSNRPCQANEASIQPPSLAFDKHDATPVSNTSNATTAGDSFDTKVSPLKDGEVSRVEQKSEPTVRTPMQRIDTSVRLQDTASEGRPSIFLFIFVNPNSGDQKGADLIHLAIQHFRLRRFPQVQVEIHNILDDKDRDTGFQRIALIQDMVKLDQLPAIRSSPKEEEEEDASHLGTLSPDAVTRHIHVWSAGGDGTVMSVIDLLDSYHINLDLVFLSCIPFGTGNDFSQVLGWGRTIPHKDVLGHRLSHLEDLISQRLEKSAAARLDIWEVEMGAYPSGAVKVAGPDRQDGHDVAEVPPPQSEDRHVLVRKMCNYMSIGVQGYVGSGFEKHRAGQRLANMLVYTIESIKWVFFRGFPPITRFLDRITRSDELFLLSPDPQAKPHESTDDVQQTTTAEMTIHPIDFVIQNIPHIWGREIDLWGDAQSGLESVRHRSGPTDSQQWTPQLANDGKLEVMAISTMFSYLKKLANLRKHLSRIGQFDSPFEIHFRPPPKQDNPSTPSFFQKNNSKNSNTVCIMCDGEFYILKDPKCVKFQRFAQIWTLGRNDDRVTGRLVTDERASAHTT